MKYCFISSWFTGMKNTFRLCFECLWLLSATVWGAQAEAVQPVVRNFTKEVYDASGQNWCITQDRLGRIYSANSIGLLEYDGSTWTFYPSPGGNIIRAVAADTSGIIYSSGYMELGFWKRDDNGNLLYTSLTDQARSLFLPNTEFWNIFIDGKKVIFQAFNQLLIYEDGTFKAINFSYFVNSLTRIGGKMYINILNRGIFELKDTTEVPFLSGDFFNNKIIRFFLPFGKGRYLIGTASEGIFLADGHLIREWIPVLNPYFIKNQINRGCYLPSGDILIGTILDGISLISRDGTVKWQANSRNGLQNNTVLGLFCDVDHNIWAALDQGIDVIEPVKESGVRFNHAGNIGAVYSAALFENKIYLGTNQGLFARDQVASGTDFSLVPGTQGQVWDLKVIGNQLIAGHNSGTFAVSDGSARLISGISGAFAIRPDPFDPGSYLQCSYSNLVKYRFEKGEFVRSKVYFNFNELIRFIEFDHLGNLWAGHMHRGIFRLMFNSSRDSVKIVKYYGRNSPFGKESGIYVNKIGQRIVFTTGEQLFTYDDLTDTIVPFTDMNRNLGDYAKTVRIIPGGFQRYWFIMENSLAFLQIVDNKVKVLKEIPFAVFNNRLIRNFENIIPVNDRETIVCLENGYALIDVTKSVAPSSLTGKTPLICAAWQKDVYGNSYQLPIYTGEVKIPWKKNSINFRFATTHYASGKITYQWLLDKLTPNWSEKSEIPMFSIDRLPAGTYKLKVRASDPWGNQSRLLTIPIRVLPPWYATTTVRIIFLAALLTLLFFLRKSLVTKIRSKEQRQREENEKELISVKNEKLQAEISFKSKELASSTMAIIKKNEFLLDLKNLVIRQKNLLGSRFPDKYFSDLLRKIDDNLSSHDEWKIFETNFEQAHEEFLKNLKSKFPDLTPGDMRLCAFLRMNLSSKEIAPLMGISIRGVENHRYRLRQKMNLTHEDNLIEIILNL